MTSESTIAPSWEQRVAQYLQNLQSEVQVVSTILEQSMVAATTVDAAGVTAHAARLREALQQLEVQVANRQQLLQASDAPQHGETLIAKLHAGEAPLTSELAARAETLAATINEINHRAVSLFVCQYHLADLSNEIVRILSGSTAPATYGNTSPAANQSGGGTLFNEAA